MSTAAVSYLCDLVRLPSINPMGRSWTDSSQLYEHRVTDYLETFFRHIGVPYERQSVAPQRDNIIARYHSPRACRTVLFEVHQDTVPVQEMIVDPFGGEIRGGRLYGRGACDVKGSMAVMLSVLQRLVEERPRHAPNLILACTVDEEHTFQGVQHLASTVAADMAIVAEPTRLKIVDAHKGLVRWKLRVAGRACHSSRPADGINAIYRMGRILQAIEAYAAELAANVKDLRLGTATISVGRIEGGVSVNTIPDQCVIEIDRRLIPGEVAAEAPLHLEQYIREQLGESVPFHCEPVWLACPALNAGHSAEVVERLGAAIDAVLGEHETIAVPFGTDASTLAEADIPTVVFGPGDIAQAHTADEWIELDQLAKAEEILYRFLTFRDS